MHPGEKVDGAPGQKKYRVAPLAKFEPDMYVRDKGEALEEVLSKLRKPQIDVQQTSDGKAWALPSLNSLLPSLNDQFRPLGECLEYHVVLVKIHYLRVKKLATLDKKGFSKELNSQSNYTTSNSVYIAQDRTISDLEGAIGNAKAAFELV